MRARDSYEQGHGRIFGKVAGMAMLFDDRGPEIDQGTLVRYLSEIIWFPTAFLGENISWEEVDHHSAQVNLTDRGQSVSGLLHFTEDGRLKKFSTRRYRGSTGQYRLESWSIPITAYAIHGGFNLPVKGQVVWNLAPGDLPYFEWEILTLEYNLPT